MFYLTYIHMKPKDIPQPLTSAEQKEFDQLKNKIFAGHMFVVIDEQKIDNSVLQRYDELLQKRMQHLAYHDYLMTNN